MAFKDKTGLERPQSEDPKGESVKDVMYLSSLPVPFG